MDTVHEVLHHATNPVQQGLDHSGTRVGHGNTQNDDNVLSITPRFHAHIDILSEEGTALLFQNELQHRCNLHMT